MMIKILEVRDRLTFIPVLVAELHPENPEQFYLLRRAGYAHPSGDVHYMISKLTDGETHHDPFAWEGRTMVNAALSIEKNFETLKDGDVIDVEYILGETDAPKRSERFDPPP